MPLTKILIAVKTYPTLSEKYDELVCTAGFREDGSWIRIYPVPFRKLDYSKMMQRFMRACRRLFQSVSEMAMDYARCD